MTHEPRGTEDIYRSLRESLKNKISKLTNFSDRSFNYVWTQAFSEEIHRLEAMAVAVELSGWIDYAGGPITDEDLDDLGYGDDITAEEVNQFMDDSQLDNLVQLVGIDRFEGSRATTTVNIKTQSEEIDIPEGTLVTTRPDPSGETLDFETVNDETSPAGIPDIQVPVIATEVGEEYEVQPDQIVRFEEPPIGVKSVANPNQPSGGEERESNDDLRARAKEAIVGASDGGTAEGIKSYIRTNIEGVGDDDVIIDEFVNEQPPYVDVIVDGGLPGELRDAIEFSRPTGIEHNLVRPEVLEIAVNVALTGVDINTDNVKDDITEYLTDLGLEDNFYQDELIRQIMTSDEDIVNIGRLDANIERMKRERFEYDSDLSPQEYRLDYTFEDYSNGSITVTQPDRSTPFEQGVDYTVEDRPSTGGDGWKDTIVWNTGNDTPKNEEVFIVSYDVTLPTTPLAAEYGTDLVRDEEKVVNLNATETFDYIDTEDQYKMEEIPFDNDNSTIDDGTETYDEGVEYDIIDADGSGFKQTIDWSEGTGSGKPSENDAADFTITYEQKAYDLEYEVVETRRGEIDDENGATYTEGEAYELVDTDQDREDDAVAWDSVSVIPSNGTKFYITYLTEGDRTVGIRRKIDPGEVEVSVE